MKPIEQVSVQFLSRSVNEGFARGVVAAFLARADPTVEQLIDLKTAVSEGVTNAIVHAYPGQLGKIKMTLALYESGRVRVTITDYGCGIADIPKAMEPLYTTGDPELRAGLGFAVMQNFTDQLKVRSKPGKGTKVTLYKQLSPKE